MLQSHAKNTQTQYTLVKLLLVMAAQKMLTATKELAKAQFVKAIKQLATHAEFQRTVQLELTVQLQRHALQLLQQELHALVLQLLLQTNVGTILTASNRPMVQSVFPICHLQMEQLFQEFSILRLANLDMQDQSTVFQLPHSLANKDQLQIMRTCSLKALLLRHNALITSTLLKEVLRLEQILPILSADITKTLTSTVLGRWEMPQL